MSVLAMFGRMFSGTDTRPSATPGLSNDQRLAAHESFKTAVRDGDVPGMEALLASKRVAVTDELAGGRGLLQFAVMAKSVKGVKLLIAQGADALARDSLGASATTLATKSGNASIIGALQAP